MEFPAYKPITELTDEEIAEVMKIVYPSLGTDAEDAAELVEIIRDTNRETLDITCKSAWTCDDDDLPDGPVTSWSEDFFQLDELGMTAYDFGLRGEETLLIKQYLLAKGCNPLLHDNPYIS